MRESRPGVLASGVMVLRRWEIVNPGSSSISWILGEPKLRHCGGEWASTMR